VLFAGDVAAPSFMPNLSCKRVNGFGAHQHPVPSQRTNAGSKTIRTNVASTITASVSPTPNIRMNDTCEEI